MKTDKQLQHDVLSQLAWEPSIDASQIGVAAKDGIVTLTGSVASYAEKTMTENVTKRVYGVKGVTDEIVVEIADSGRRTDAEIAGAALEALRWDITVPDERVKVTVRNGCITLDGTVQWQFQRSAAEDAVRNLAGVLGVSNQIKLKTHVTTGDVREKIEAAFRRSAELDSRRVGIEVQDNKVILRGYVSSWAERKEAERAAWGAPGVTEVVNCISVNP